MTKASLRIFNHPQLALSALILAIVASRALTAHLSCNSSQTKISDGYCTIPMKSSEPFIQKTFHSEK